MSNLCPHSSSNHTLVQPVQIQAEDTVTIQDFRQLQKLELEVTPRSPPNRTLLSSITSLELRKIIFSAECVGGWDVHTGLKERALVDKQLCELVDRLRVAGYHHILEVELRLTRAGDDPGKYDFTKFLTEFREKGVVTAVGQPDSSFFHSYFNHC